MSMVMEPRYWQNLTFERIPVDVKIRHYLLDPAISFKNAVLNAMAYLQKLGYSKEQTYLILTAAPNESRMSDIVDVPNSCEPIVIPTVILNFDVTPSEDGPQKAPLGKLVPCVGGN